jgi:23S rRNA (uridine2552-2'-O)-methyltransferase
MTTRGRRPSSPKRAPDFSAARRAAVRVKKAKGRKISSTLWLERQLNDPYVAAAQKEGYRSRAAYKLLELDERFGFLKRGARVADLGAAPGGWAQVAASRVGAAHGKGKVVALDLAEVEPMSGVTLLVGDVADPDMPARIREGLGGAADVILSDMAPPATGHRATDHLRIVALAEAALALAEDVLAPGGALVLKVWQGGAEPTLLAELKRRFEKVRHVKPKASRQESAELYLVAQGFRPAPH